MTEQCTFCRILSEEEHANRLYETERVLAFLDAAPVSRGHTLVVPKAHVTDLMRADPRVTTAVFDATSRVADAMEHVLAPDGYSVFHTTGPLVGSIDHAHVHLIPRYEDDNVRVSLPRLSDSEPASVASELRDQL